MLKMTRQTIKYYLIGLTFVFCCYVSVGQQNKIDSIQKLLLTQKADTDRVETFIMLGQLYLGSTNYPEAIDNFLKALRIFESIRDSSGIAICNQQIGGIYYELKNYNSAVKHFSSAITLFEKFHNTNGLSVCYLNISSAYLSMNKLELALECNKKAEKAAKEIDSKLFLSMCYTVRGGVYSSMKNYNSAIEQYQKAVILMEQTGDRNAMGITYAHVGTIYTVLNDIEKALAYYNKALEFINENTKWELYQDVSVLYSKKKNFEKAYEYSQLFHKANDSIIGKEALSKIDKLQNKYEAEKIAQITKLENEKRELEFQAKVRTQRVIIFSVSAGLLLFVVLVFIVYKAYKQKQEANKIIAGKNKDILDSIRYAKRIQTSLLPTHKYIDRILSEKDQSTGA